METQHPLPLKLFEEPTQKHNLCACGSGLHKHVTVASLARLFSSLCEDGSWFWSEDTVSGPHSSASLSACMKPLITAAHQWSHLIQLNLSINENVDLYF